MAKVLLTGASGYIAKHIAVQLLNAGHTVRASVREISRANEVRNAVAGHLSSTAELAERLTFVELNLDKDESWEAATAGTDILMHTASPFPLVQPKSEQDLITPAVDGTRRALTAAHASGVKRVILTSSIAAVYGGQPSGTLLTEELWTDVAAPNVDAYTKSKTLAERMAWQLAEEFSLELTTINPSVVVGAPIDKKFGSSVSIVERILARKDPVLPNLTFSYVDVRDVATLHVLAIDNHGSIGKRFLATSESLTFLEVAQTLQSAFPDRKFVTRVAPNQLIKLVAIFDKTVRTSISYLGNPMHTSNHNAAKTFGIKFRSAKESIIETANFLILND